MLRLFTRLWQLRISLSYENNCIKIFTPSVFTADGDICFLEINIFKKYISLLKLRRKSIIISYANIKL